MRIATKRRAHWVMSGETGLGERRHWVSTRSGLVEVARFGRGDPIVLVPGLAGGWRLMAPLARRISRRGFEVLVPGLPGERSPLTSPRPASIAEIADSLADVITHLRLERPTVFGVSFGGTVALELAVAHPGRLGGLLLMGVEARFHHRLPARIARRVLRRFPLPRDNGFVNQFFHLLFGGRPEPGPLLDFVIQRCWDTDQCLIAHRLELLDAFDVTDQLWRIDTPTLVLAGARDAIVPVERQRALARGIVGARFEILDDAGHVGFLTHGRQVARAVRPLLAALRRSYC